MMYDTNSLYPVVHDLTDAEVASSPFCCADGWGMCFSLQELLVPSEEPRAPSSISQPTLPRTPTIKKRRLLRSTSGNDADSVVTEPSVESVYQQPRTSRFQDTYVLTRQIHQGRFCMIWESIHRQTGQRFATKVVDRRTLTPREDAAVVKEVGILEQLEAGRFICTNVDFFQEISHYYIVMDYAQCGSLQQQPKPLPEEDVRNIARCLLEGLQYLHSRDILHRNLRPENILLNSKEEAWIADLGMAIHLPYYNDERGMLTGKCGSPLYAAPEVQNRLPYDTQADLWSLGVVLFYALSGKLPFYDSSKRALLKKITRADYTFGPEWNGISKSAQRFISGLLCASPQERMTATLALEHSWVALPTECVAMEAPIEAPLQQVTPSPQKRVRFSNIPKGPSEQKPKRKLRRVFSILRRKRNAEKENTEKEEEESISSRTISSTSTSN